MLERSKGIGIGSSEHKLMMKREPTIVHKVDNKRKEIGIVDKTRHKAYIKSETEQGRNEIRFT